MFQKRHMEAIAKELKICFEGEAKVHAVKVFAEMLWSHNSRFNHTMFIEACELWEGELADVTH